MCDSKNCSSSKHISGGNYICDHNNLKANYPHLVSEWHEQNGLMENYSNGSNKKVIWVCSRDGSHENWEATINDRTKKHKNPSGCPSCSRIKRKICDPTFSLSTKRPDLCKEFDYDKNKTSPTTISYCSHIKVSWICSTTINCSFNKIIS